MSRTRLVRADGAETRRRIKVVAQRLFAERGIDGVSVQEILGAAGQRNRASLQYHFGSKEALIAELVVDGARVRRALRFLPLLPAQRGVDSQGALPDRGALFRPVERPTLPP